MKNKLYILILLFQITPLLAQERVHTYLYDRQEQPRQQIVDVINLKGELTIQGKENYLIGKTTLTFKTFYNRVDSILIDCQKLNIKDVSIDGKPAKFKWYGREIAIYPAQKLETITQYDMLINYDAHPNFGLNFTGWQDDEKFKRKQIWAHGPSGWTPFINIKHDILTSEFIVNFDKKYKVFSNGKLISEIKEKNNTKTWHYKIDKPHVVYLFCLLIGDYEVKKFNTERGLPLEYLYYKDMESRFDVAYKYSTEMFAFLEEETGTLYPWSLYRNMPVSEYMYGGMETTTSTIFGDFMYIDQKAWNMRNYVNVNVHELTHQWFGNYLSNINKDIWLTESFATYFAKKFEQSIFGEDYYQWERDKEMQRTFDAAKRNNYPVANTRSGSARWYPKGSLVLDMLRHLLGDDAFKATIKHYIDMNKNKVVYANDFLKAIRETTGQSMEWFFEEWIYRGGEPHYKISYTPIKIKNNAFTKVNIEQIHKTSNLVGLFDMPIEIQVFYKDGSKSSHTQRIFKKSSEALIPNNANQEISYVLFDPNRKILKKMTFYRTFEELSNQALKSTNMIDRLEAIRSIEKTSIDKKMDLLANIFKKEKYHLIKSEIIKQIIQSDTVVDLPQAVQIIRQAINSGNELVRRAVVENLKTIPKRLQKDYEKLLEANCYKNIELSLENLTQSFPNKTIQYLEKTKELIGWRGKNIKIKWLEIAVLAGKKGYIQQLIDYSSTNYDFETRMNAFTSLKNINYCDFAVAKNLFKASLYWNYKLVKNANNIIKYFLQQKKYKHVISDILYDNTWSIEERKKLKKYMK